MSGNGQLGDALEKLIQGAQLIGDGLTTLIRLVLASAGLQVPDVAIRIGAIVVGILTIWKLGSAVNKVILLALIFLLLGLASGFIPAIIKQFFLS